MKWYGLNMNRKEMKGIEFCSFVNHLLYEDSQLSKIFKAKEYSENDKFEFKLRMKIETRINNISSEWKRFQMFRRNGKL